jgi:mono/diheme cytochrome c family protein
MNHNKRKTRLYSFVALLLIGGLIFGLERLSTAATAQQRVDFNRDIRPILSENCFTCHGPDDGTRKAKLRFDTKEGAFAKAGVIVAGNAANSRLIKRIVTTDPDVIMPPPGSGHKLTKAQIDLLTRWVDEGAQWSLHWSFVAPQRPELPKVKNTNWPRNPIDYFVLARLEQEGLKPSPEADKALLLRRVTLDLTGLPPTQKELDEFLADAAPNAYEKAVDRLLASPRYGERMAYRWLDAARYADTHGYQLDSERSMWRWRDWVIEAFNQNLPFDQFTIQQLAGDLLPNPTLDQRIATAFNRNHRANSEAGIVPAEYYVEYIVDRVDTTSTVFMGLTTGCARCHSHKYDPISHKEYYQLFAYFNSIPETGMVSSTGNARPWLAAPDKSQQQQLTALESEIARTEKQLSALGTKLTSAQRRWEKSLPGSAPPQWFPAAALAYSFDEAAALDIRKPLMPEAAKPALKPTEVAVTPPKEIAKPTPPAVPGFRNGAPVYVAAPTGQGVAFDGKLLFDAEQSIRFGEAPRGKEVREKFALSVWFYPESEQSGAIVTYLADDPDTKEIKLPRDRGFGLFFLDGKIQFNVVAGWDEDSVKTETRRTIPAQQWHHLLAVFDAENALEHVQIYIDGQRELLHVKQSSLYNSYANAANKLRMGGGGGSALRFKGKLDELRIYKAMPDAAQVATLACADSLNRIAALPVAQRNEGQRLKISQAFFAQGAPAAAHQVWEKLARLKQEKIKLEASFSTVMVMQEMPAPRPTFLLKRGAYDAPGEPVERGVPAVLPPFAQDLPNNRLGLAKWLVSPEHPLTARVTVNRFWQMLFGTGLVKTVEDFGAQGEAPSHPELLDWLAVEFQNADWGLRNADSKTAPRSWNVKALLKTIVISATYRQSSAFNPQSAIRDPQSDDPFNRLLARGPRFRLSAEMLRDQALFVSGLLVEKTGGPSVKTYQPADVYQGLVFEQTKYDQAKGENLWRRSLYTFWKRTILTPNMLVLDASAREFCTVRENRTNTPLQALTLMNDVTYVEAARMLAARMLTEGGTQADTRFQWAFRQVISRPPTPTELQVLRENLTMQLTHFQRNPNEATKLLAVGEKRNSEQFNASELAAYTTIASLILNLNEAITRQ